jgi:imidazolonepropionase-like amidohydrolase
MKIMKKLFIKTLIIALAFLPFALLAQDVDDGSLKPRAGKFALTNASIETVTKGIILNGTIIIHNGKIEAIGANIQVPADAEVIDCTGKWIYPGMIDGGTRLGLVEVNSVPETADQQEIGNFTPNAQALTAINPNGTAIPVTRVSGVTTVLSMTQGGLFSGTAALINLVGYTPNQMYAGFKGVQLNFPGSARRGGFDRRSDDEIKRATDAGIKSLNDLWDRAALYLENQKAGTARYYPEMAALAEVIEGKVALLIEVNGAQDIENAIKWVQDKKVAKPILTGVAEGWRVADKIAASKIPVVTGPVIAIPTRQSDRYDRAYANPGLMAKAGVKVAIRTMDTENVRNLPFNAGFAIAYGMDKTEALKAVTIYPAEIFGVADQLGSLEQGKSATLLISTGDPFETKTQIEHVFIDGYLIPMISRHTRLYNEFLERSPGVKK